MSNKLFPKKILQAKTSSKRATSVSKNSDSDLLETEQQLFELEQYPLLDIQAATIALGSEAAMKDMIPLFIEKAISEKELLAFHAAYANKNWEQVADIAHKLKGVCVYCGVTRMRYACLYVEHYYKAGNSELYDRLCKQFLVVLEQTKKHITAWIQENQG